jgi:nitrite reductase/ring-hydroxylating ferredoxin subunit
MSDEEKFNEAIEAILADRSPRRVARDLSAEEQEMLHVAQLLHGSSAPSPEPEFVERLHQQIFASPRRVSRRTAFLSGVGALAAGLLAGIGIERKVVDSENQPPSALVPVWGKWYRVASVADLEDGAVRAFSAGAIRGFVIKQNGQIRALSSICTHMGCGLVYAAQKRALECPCHGASFNLSGQLNVGPGGYGTSSNRTIPPLPRLVFRIREGSVEVLGA